MLDPVLRDSTALLARRSQRNAHQGPLAIRSNSSQLNNVKIALLESSVEPTTWWGQQDPAEKGTIVRWGRQGKTRLSVLLEDTALQKRMSRTYVPMEHLGALAKGSQAVIALTAPLDITVKVLGWQMRLVYVQRGIMLLVVHL